MRTHVKRRKLPPFLKPSGSLEDYKKKLQAMGYKQIGDGFESTVWAKDDTHVLKLVDANSAYADYLEMVLANQENPYFPRVFDVKRFKDVKWGRGTNSFTDYMVVSMERLGELPEFVDLFAGPDAGRKFLTRLQKAVGSTEWGKVPIDKAVRKTFKNKEEKMLLFAMDELKKQHNDLDLHRGNIMLRGNQPVVIDPVV